MRFVFIVLTLVMLSCTQKSDDRKPVEDPSVILKSFQNYWAYHNKYIQLSDDFTGADRSFNPIDKGEFLQKLVTGNYLPVKVQSDQSTYYQLYRVDHWEVQDIRNTIVDLANIELANFNRENTPFPKFNVEDLDGNFYSTESLKGKLLVIKLWFIGCQQCIEEMPFLNQLVDSYKNQKDIVFLSLALDQEDTLREYLKNRQFEYPTVGNQKEFIEHQLQASIYPTHIIVNKDGKIVKIVHSYQELARALKKSI